jgi:hypothetical protein
MSIVGHACTTVMFKQLHYVQEPTGSDLVKVHVTRLQALHELHCHCPGEVWVLPICLLDTAPARIPGRPTTG